MDVWNVNLKFYQKLTKNRKEQKFYSLLDIGSCSLRIIHGSFKTGAKKSKWNRLTSVEPNPQSSFYFVREADLSSSYNGQATRNII